MEVGQNCSETDIVQLSPIHELLTQNIAHLQDLCVPLYRHSLYSGWRT